MCTIVVLSRIHPDASLVVAANRDEFYAREAEAPQVLTAETGAVGGRDVKGGGTWFGATADGFFVGLTNQRTFRGADPSLSSRGEIAIEALRCGTVAAVRNLLDSLDPSQYNPFNLIYGDPRGVEVAYARTEAVKVQREALPEGVHVLTNDRLGSKEFPKAQRAEALSGPVLDASGATLWEPVRILLSDHAVPPLGQLEPPPADSLFNLALVQALQALCIHTPTYGTRSATALVANDAGLVDFRFADGAPCQAPLESAMHLFR
ncbi:MAG: NRDE family protein [Deltaproteobacteria bacterium]|nr:NRDE family protein [Deltaproteobacteria bacterium]